MNELRLRILNLDPYHYSPEARAILEEVADVEDGPVDRHRLVDIIGHYDALVLRFSHRIDETLLSGASRLKAIATNATGLDHIDIEAASRRGVEVVSLRGQDEFLRGIDATAELTWGLLIALLRNMPKAFASVAEGGWDRELFVGRELTGRTIGILGMGRIGKKIGQYARAFLMDVQAYDSNPAVRSRVGWVTWHDYLHSMLENIDVLSIHVPSTRATHRLIGRRELACLRNEAVVINTSRGEIVDESAVVDALRQGKIAGYAADVLRGEGTPGFPRTSPIWCYSREGGNVLLTPHIGGAAYKAWEKTEIFIARKLVRTLMR
jgi:D-3-phosphoglycerate dehydrogenase